MLSKLYIENYALIEKSDIDFGEGFTVITGETGAGKSIMLDALSLIMGARADTKAIADKSKKTIVEAHFTKPEDKLSCVFDTNALDWDSNEIIIRREISPNGKNRSFINDTPITLSVLAEVTTYLIDIHSQHSNNVLSESSRQLDLLDSFSNDHLEKEEYQKIFHSYVNLRNKIKRIREQREKSKENKEYILFKLEQLDKLKPKSGELENLEKEYEILVNADNIVTHLGEAINEIEGEKDSVIHKLNNIGSSISEIDLNVFSTEENNIFDRIESMKIELRDIGDCLSAYMQKIECNPERIEKIGNRINAIEEVMKRFKVGSEEELVELHTNLRKDFEAIGGDNLDLFTLEREMKELAKNLKNKAEILSKKREEGAELFAKEIEKRGRPLGLSNLKFKIDMEKGKMNSDGQDIVSFNCSFNKSQPLQPIGSIASGGEISRLMLTIKSIMAEKTSLPTVIFDEIDTGVSGEIAHKMGKMMREMSEKMQVMSVTHLPQVAASGHYHLKVYKSDETEKTVSHVMFLDHENRVKEIAGMLSGKKINEAAMKNAETLLES